MVRSYLKLDHLYLVAKHHLFSSLVGYHTKELFISMRPGSIIFLELQPSLTSGIISTGSGGCCVETHNPFLRHPMHDCSFIVSNWVSVGRGHSSVNSLKSCRICPRTPARWPACPIYFSAQSAVIYSKPNSYSVCPLEFSAFFCSEPNPSLSPETVLSYICIGSLLLIRSLFEIAIKRPWMQMDLLFAICLAVFQWKNTSGLGELIMAWCWLLQQN